MPFDFHADAHAGRDVAKALGFDPHGMVEINLKFRAGDLLVVTTEQLVPAEKLPKVIGEIVKRKYIVNCVAEPTEQRHDDPTCCGGRQVPDVGDGWRDVRTGEDAEHLADGDWMQDADGFWEPIYSFSVDGFGSPHRRYRRRVTPEAEAPQLSPSAVSAMCQRNERAALLAKIATLRSEGDQQQEIILHAGMEVERLTAEVERLRLTPEEREAVTKFVRHWSDSPLHVGSKIVVTLRKFLERQGGGE